MEFFIPRIIQSCIIIPGKNCEHLSCSMILPLFLAVPRNVSSLLRVLVQVSVQKNINEA